MLLKCPTNLIFEVVQHAFIFNLTAGSRVLFREVYLMSGCDTADESKLANVVGAMPAHFQVDGRIARKVQDLMLIGVTKVGGETEPSLL